MTPDLEAIRARNEERKECVAMNCHECAQTVADVENLFDELSRFQKVGERLYIRVED